MRPRPLVATVALLATAAVAAQSDYDFDRVSPGSIGQPLLLAHAGAPASTSILLMLSTNTGPLPLRVVDPRDSRVLEVGPEFAPLWFAQPTGSGSGSFSLPVPAGADLHGAVLQFQTLTLPGSTLLVDRISNRVTVQLGEAGRAANLPAVLAAPRALAVTTAADHNHEVVLAGGGSGSILGPIGLQSSEIVDLRTLEPRPGPQLTVARALAAGVTLGDGRTLICGGVDQNGGVLASAEVYDPATRTFTAAAGGMAVPRALHAAALLADGRVLVAGGTTVLSDAVQALANAQDSVEIFDPATGTFAGARSMARRLLAPGLDSLGTGRILVSGGFEVRSLFGIPIPVGSVASCQLYDAGANAWSNAASMRQSRALHASATALLPSGELLVCGGASSGPDLTQAMAIAAAETYDPAANAWTALPDMAVERIGHSVAVVGGRVIVAGGARGSLAAQTALDSVQALDPATRQWRALPNLVAARGGHGAALAADGLLLLLGGQGLAATLDTVETIR